MKNALWNTGIQEVHIFEVITVTMKKCQAQILFFFTDLSRLKRSKGNFLVVHWLGSALIFLRTWVRSLLWELRSHKLCISVKKKKKVRKAQWRQQVSQRIHWCPSLCSPVDCNLPGSSAHGISRQETGVSCHFLLQGFFPTQGSNPGLLHLLHWQVGSLPLYYLGNPQDSKEGIYKRKC